MSEEHEHGMLSNFDGTGNIDFWLSVVEAVKVERNWKDEDLVKRACLLLRGEAKLWFEHGRLWEKKDLTWDQFSTLIKQRFSRKVPRHVVTANIGKLKLKAKEDIRDFASRMSDLANQSEPKIDDSDMCGMLMKALPVYYHTVHVDEEEDEDQFEAMVNACRRIQLLDTDADMGVPAERPEHGGRERDERPKVNNVGPSRKKFTGNCNYCGKPGHKEFECHKKERDEAEAKPQATARGARPNTRESNRNAQWDPRTHQKIKPEGVNCCMFCGEEDHEREDCYMWKRLSALIGDDAIEEGGGGPSGGRPRKN